MDNSSPSSASAKASADRPRPSPARGEGVSPYIIALATLILGCALCVFIALYMWQKPRDWRESILWIPQGTGTQTIAAATAQASGVLVLPVKIGLRLTALKPLQAGEYDLRDRPSLAAVFDHMQKGQFIKRSVTIPEGLTSFQIMQRLAQTYGLEQDCPDFKSVPEGSLLPQTYAYIRGEKCTALLSRMQAAMSAMEAKIWAGRDAGLPFSNWQDAVILASIVERETGLSAERPRVAGVFINRLRVGMPLQSDPTTIYAVSGGTGDMERPLTRADWKYPSPFNTYYIRALPPAPIAHPGLASLMAVLHPESHEYFYFVTNGTGGHAFAKTLDAHNKNVVRK